VSPFAILAAAAAAAWLLSSSSRSSAATGSSAGSRRIEGYAAHEAASSCDPDPKPGVRAFRAFVLARFGGGDLGISRDCAIGGPSEHHEGRAWDWGTTPGPESLAFLSWLLGPDAATGEPHGVARRAGVMYAIFNHHIWRAYGARTWEPYSGPNPHTDHVHLSFSRAGAAGQTSFYRGRP
jgi:hypothetical protein